MKIAFCATAIAGILFAILPGVKISATSNATSTPEDSASAHTGCRIVYAGFVGALETSNHAHSGVVQIRDILRGPDYSDVCADSFIPVSWTSGRDWVLTHFPSHAGQLTAEESANCPRVILLGHSTGGWAMLSVARALRAKNIPVELTVQIDSVGFTDYTVPRNVRYSAVFHAWDALMFMTTKHIRLEDPAYTTMLADVLVKGASHLSITRDPRIRELVLNSIKTLRTERTNAGLHGLAVTSAPTK
jgi:hypothetical protein